MKTMIRKRIVILGLAQAIGTTLYVGMAAIVMIGFGSFIELGPGEEKPGLPARDYLGLTGFLLLFVVSACICGSIVLGYPLVLALRRQIKEAVLLVAATVSWLILLFILLVLASALVMWAAPDLL